MKAQIITIGDEILSGQTLNTNAAYIGNKLVECQVDVLKTSVVGDESEAIIYEFKNALDHYDIVIVTGGLGPTHDDITRKAIVNFFNTELVLNKEVLADITKFFDKRNKKLTPTNKDQAFVPKIAGIIRNMKGTAPGYWIDINDKIFISLPGVPYEMKEMVDKYILPKLQEKNINHLKKLFTLNLLTTGIAESHLYERLGNLDELLQGAKLTFLPNQFGVKLIITDSGSNLETTKDNLTQLEQKIRALVGRFIYGKNNDTLESVVARLLIDRGMTVSVAESCTGGLISNRLTNVSGSSAYFERAIVTYSNGAKVELLNIDEDLIQKYGSVSLEVARLMADGVKAISGTDIGLAATGIMGPTGATTDKPVGLVYVGICDEKICTAREFRFGDDRLLNKEKTSQSALELLRRNLLGIPYEE
ncbi:competence/damage-inducible protein A [Bacteroidota bacterium]